jgi:hypothetical protein
MAKLDHAIGVGVSMRQFCIHVLMMSGLLYLTTTAVVLADALPDSLRLCMQLQDDAHRLSCYDREVASLSTRRSADHATAPQPSNPVPSPEKSFGLRGELADKVRKQSSQAEEPVLDQLTSQVVHVSQRAHGELVLTLSNGQAWAQNQASANFVVRVGEPVTIKPGALGSFLLSNSSGRATRVTRVQ